MASATTARQVRTRQREAVEREAGRPARAPSRRRRMALALILTAAFMVVLDFSIVNSVLAVVQSAHRLRPNLGGSTH